MITDFKKVINKMVKMSENGWLALSYENPMISIEFKFPERLELNIRDGEYRLWHVDEVHAVPSEIRIKETDVEKSIYYEIGEFKQLESTEVIEIYLKDGGMITCFEDVR